MRFCVINGPNLNLLGEREPSIYGKITYDGMCRELDQFAKDHSSTVEFVQSNCEGILIDAIQSARKTADAIIINPGAYTHTSYALHDALRSIQIPAIEVHISNISSREDFRKNSLTASACIGQISGLGIFGYKAAMMAFLDQSAKINE